MSENIDCKRIWILNHHAHENGNRHYELGREWVQRGYQVVVIASSYSQIVHNYISKEQCLEHEISPNFHFVYLKTNPPYKNNGLRRICNMFSYEYMTKRYAKYLIQKYGEPDYVIGSCVHPLAWEAAYWIAKKYGAKFICEVRDFWPLSLIEIKGISRHHPLVLFFGLIEKRAYRHADIIVTTFPYGYLHICDEMGYPRDHVAWIPNGIRIDTENQEKQLPDDLKNFIESHWCCIYAGSFVKSEGLDFMLEAFNELKDDDIYFAIIGSGHEQEKMEKMIRKLSLTKVRIFPRIEKKQVMSALRVSACCLAALQNHSIYRFGLSMNKLNDYLLSEKPVIFACDAPNIAKEAGHITMPYGDVKAFAEEIRQVKAMKLDEIRDMGERGMRLIQEQYSYDVIADKYLTVLNDIQ